MLKYGGDTFWIMKQTCAGCQRPRSHKVSFSQVQKLFVSTTYRYWYTTVPELSRGDANLSIC